jgi:glycosyltransferase involved in cell wall biosynthesis/tRNA A-37 threonylcarbamoyl transferase component Bud32
MKRFEWQINNRLFPHLKPEDLDFLVSEFKQGIGKTIKDNPHRTVKKMNLKGGEIVFVKQTKIRTFSDIFKHFFLPGKISKEWRIMNQFNDLGIPTARPVALGKYWEGFFLKEAFLITQSLGDMITLHAFYKQHLKTKSKNHLLAFKDDLIQKLAGFIHFLHLKGIIHNDIHIENILVSADKSALLSFYLIDLYKAEIEKNPSETKKALNLARVLFSTSESNVFNREDQKEFIRIYYSYDGVSEKRLRSSMERIFSLMKKLADERFRSRGRKSFRPGKFFAIYREPGKFIISRREFSISSLPNILNLHEELTKPIRKTAHPDLRGLSPAILKASRRSIVTKINLNSFSEKPFCLKEERNDPERPSLIFYLTRSRNRKSWANSNKLLLKKIPTPRCLALQEERRYGLRVRSFLIMEYVENAFPLNTYIQQTFRNHQSRALFQKKMAFISFMAGFVRTLHQKGIYHSDLKSANLLVREKGEGGWECFIVDLDRIHFLKKTVSLSQRIKNLSQLNASIADCITPSNRTKFFKVYDDSHQWDRKKRKEIYRQILKICRSRRTDFYGVNFDSKPFYPQRESKRGLPSSFQDNPLKILHINTELTWRGGEQQVLYLIKGLTKKGYISHLICQPKGSLYDHALQEGVKTFPLPMRGEVDLIAAFKIAQRIRQEKYDLVHSHTSHGHSLVIGASFFLRKPPIRIVTRRLDFSIFRHNFLGMNIYKYTKGVDHIIAISQKVRDVLIKDGISPDKISIVHSGVDVDRFKGVKGDYILQEFSIPSGTPILGNVAYLVEHKGQKYLIQAMSEVVKKHPEIRLFILGKGRLELQLKAMAEALNLERNIIFTGFRKDVGAFLNIFNLLVVSSVEEGLNSTILDALSLEVPVVATDAGGIPEVINNGETGILVPRADPEALASGILWMLSNPDQAKAMAKKGREKVIKQFSDKVMVEKNIQIYQKLISERKN